MSHVPRLNLVALLGTAAYLRWVAASGAAVGVMWWSMPLFFLLRGGQNAIHLYMGRRHNVFAPVPQPVTAPAAQPVYA